MNYVLVGLFAVAAFAVATNFCRSSQPPEKAPSKQTPRVSDDWLLTTKKPPEAPPETYEVDSAKGPKWVVSRAGRSYSVVWSQPYMWHGKSMGAPVGCLMCNEKLYADHYARELNKRHAGEGWSNGSPQSESIRKDIESTRPKSEDAARTKYQNTEPPTDGFYWMRVWFADEGRYRSGDISIVYVGLRGTQEGKPLERYYDVCGRESMNWGDFLKWFGGDERKFDFVPVESNPWYPSIPHKTLFTEYADGRVSSIMLLGTSE